MARGMLPPCVAVGRLPPRACRLTDVMTFVEILQGGHNLEISSASERVAAVRGDSGRESTGYGVGVDAKREYQGVCGRTPGCESV